MSTRDGLDSVTWRHSPGSRAQAPRLHLRAPCGPLSPYASRGFLTASGLKTAGCLARWWLFLQKTQPGWLLKAQPRVSWQQFQCILLIQGEGDGPHLLTGGTSKFHRKGPGQGEGDFCRRLGNRWAAPCVSRDRRNRGAGAVVRVPAPKSVDKTISPVAGGAVLYSTSSWDELSCLSSIL